MAVLVTNTMMDGNANFRAEVTLPVDGHGKLNRELLWARKDIAEVQKTASTALVHSELGTDSHATLLQATNSLLREAQVSQEHSQLPHKRDTMSRTREEVRHSQRVERAERNGHEATERRWRASKDWGKKRREKLQQPEKPPRKERR